MKAIICALALVGLTSQAQAGIYNMSCGQLADAKASVQEGISDVNAKIKDARNGDTVAFLKSERAELVNALVRLNSEIQDRCMGDDYND
ncbi:hypothetical protein ACLVWU_16665 [Bdellovibrio sp. HCB290]|uniref:hypothetical protein n=1 Tax=Bdellovibrio sp. HCB290 TaxID=3394356 RepID=UPI0039B50296